MPDWQEAYPAVHGALAPEYRSLPEDQVEQVLAGVLGEGVTLDDAEQYFEGIGATLAGVASAAAPVLVKALPGAVSGAMAGAALGPAGIVGGAIAGGVGSALAGGPAQPAAPGAAPAPAAKPPAKRRPRRPAAPRPAVAPVHAAAPGVATAPVQLAPVAPGAGPTAAVGSFLGALGSPTVQQALLAMLLGSAGARTVPGANDDDELSVAAITNLLGTLAAGASAEWEEIAPSAESFGGGIDFAAPEARAAWLLERIAPIEVAVGENLDEAGYDESGYDETAENGSEEAWLDELYDELEAELATDEAELATDEAELWSVSHGG